MGAYAIVNQGTGLCLDAFSSAGGGNGNPVGLWQCNGGITELWYVSKRSSGSALSEFPYLIRNARNWRSLDYPERSNGAWGWQFELWDLYPSWGQVFGLDVVQPRTSVYRIRNGRTFGYMDAYARDGGGNGNGVGMWAVTGSALQRWFFACQFGCRLPW